MQICLLRAFFEVSFKPHFHLNILGVNVWYLEVFCKMGNSNSKSDPTSLHASKLRQFETTTQWMSQEFNLRKYTAYSYFNANQYLNTSSLKRIYFGLEMVMWTRSGNMWQHWEGRCCIEIVLTCCNMLQYLYDEGWYLFHRIWNMGRWCVAT